MRGFTENVEIEVGCIWRFCKGLVDSLENRDIEEVKQILQTKHGRLIAQHNTTKVRYLPIQREILL